MRRTIIVAVVLMALASACSDEPVTGVAPNETAATTPPHLTTPTTTQPTFGQPNLGTSTVTEWQFIGTVIDDGQPVICPGGVMTSLPPQCQGVPVIGLDWSTVEGVETAGGVRWADFTLVGTYDGSVFDLTRPPQPPPVGGGETPFSVPLPCEEPEGGWQIINATTADKDGAAVGYAQAQPEFMGNWTYRLPADAAAYSVKVFTFTDNLEEHEQALRGIYGGPLCVSLVDHSLAELEAIRSRVKAVIVSAEAQAAGIYLSNGQYGDTIDIVTGQIEFYVLAAEAGAQGWLDSQFGQGTVMLQGRLQRVGQP